MLAAVEQVDAAGLDAGMLAGYCDHGLIAADVAATGHAERAEMCMRAERHDGRANIVRLATILDQPDMIEPRAVADRKQQGVMDLIGLDAVGADIAFPQGRAGRLAELQ